MRKKSVLIRFNTNFPKTSSKKWRLLEKKYDSLENYTQHLVDEIELKIPCFTSENKVVGDDGAVVRKFHISATATDIIFQKTENQVKAIII